MLRFAPSPNGLLHLGHALSARANQLMAWRLGRPLTVRMEDIDRSRSRPEFEGAILEDLAWLGIGWAPPFRRQSAHFAEYNLLLETLRQRGLIYPAFATRREIAEAARVINLPRDPDGAPRVVGEEAIIGTAEIERRRGKEPAAWRLNMAKALAEVDKLTWCAVDSRGANPTAHPADASLWGDVVLARKEIPTSYHLSVVVDDAAQGITEVVRGLDLAPATAVHALLQRLLELPPPRYHHHPLILGVDGRKLAKSTGARSLADLRATGACVVDLIDVLDHVLEKGVSAQLAQFHA